MEIEKREVIVVVVTYANRCKYLFSVLTSLQTQIPRPFRIIVVDNASSCDVTALIKQHGFDDWVSVYRNDKNEGSAAGYAKALQLALDMSSINSLYWLLDDDNVPTANALNELLTSTEKNSNGIARLSLRPDRNEFVNASRMGWHVYDLKNCFLGFHIKSIFKKFLKRLPSKYLRRLAGLASELDTLKIVKLDYAPYGGLLISRDIIEKVGLPNREFFLYADDYEYTYRISQNGYEILLIPTSIVDDVEKSWHLSGGIHPLMDPNSSKLRLFFSTRNRVYLESIVGGSKFMRLLNRFIYISFLGFKGFLAVRNIQFIFDRIDYLMKVSALGENGNLSIDSGIKLGLISRDDIP